MYKHIICVILTAVAALGFNISAENRLDIQAGVLIPYTLNASIGYEHDFNYGNSLEIFGEAGNHWHTPICCQFWKGYYWDGGLAYKHRMVRYKNGMLRLRFGGHLGAARNNFFLGCEVGLEYDYILPSGIHLVLSQKNDFNFLHGDHFRNGILLGVKFPL